MSSRVLEYWGTGFEICILFLNVLLLCDYTVYITKSRDLSHILQSNEVTRSTRV